jgi:hypothetical protein
MQISHRNQINVRFPRRSKTSDGSIGDYAHSQGTSGHNPDDTIHDNAEWDGDADKKQEVRAIDVDKDLNDEYGADMEDVVQHYIRMFRGGRWAPFRYIIYRGRIWRKANGWVTQTYTGTNGHYEHAHFSGDYSDAADEANEYDFRLDEVGNMAVTEADINKIAAAVIEALGTHDNVFRAPSWRTDQSNTHWPYEDVSTSAMEDTHAKLVSLRTSAAVNKGDVDAIAADLSSVANMLTEVNSKIDTLLTRHPEA